MTNAAKPKPLTAHPLFPAIIALWFAALFGLGSLAVGSDLIDHAVVALRLDSLMSALAPPLGMFARLMLATGLAIAGGAIGYALGRGMARRGKDTPLQPDRAPADEADPLPDAVEAPRVRRRPLTAADHEFVPYESAPLPGSRLPQIFDVTTLEPAPAELEPAPAESEPEVSRDAFIEPAIWTEIAAPEPVEPEPETEPLLLLDESPSPAAEPEVPATTVTAVLAGDPGALGTVQLAERLALALQGRRKRRVLSTDSPDADDHEQAVKRSLDSRAVLELQADDDVEEDEDELAEESTDEGYSSLLALGPVARRATLQIDDLPASPLPLEQVVIFPGQLVRERSTAPTALPVGDTTGTDTGETDRALRAALSNLQRLSGAA